MNNSTCHGTRGSTDTLSKKEVEEQGQQKKEMQHSNLLQEKKMVDHDANIMPEPMQRSSPLKKEKVSSSSYQAALADANLVLNESIASPPKENVSPPPQSTRVETNKHDLSSYPRNNHSTVERHHQQHTQQPFEHAHEHQRISSPLPPTTTRHLNKEQPLPVSYHQRPLGEENAHYLSPPPTSSALVMSNAASMNGGRLVKKLIICVMKEGDKLGFGIRHDSDRRLKVSTLQTHSSAAASQLRINDTILSVNDVDLTHMSFLEVIQHLKTLRPGELCFEVERDLVQSFVPLRMNGPRSSSPSMSISSCALSGSSIDQSGQVDGSNNTKRIEPNPRCMDKPNPPRKRARGILSSPAEIEMEFRRLERSHRQEMNAMMLNFNKERTERLQLVEKNASLRKRLKCMLIECDEVRVNANKTISGLKEQASKDIHELEKALASARAQLRLTDRSPNFAAQDTLMNELENYKIQLERIRTIERERTGYFKTRYAIESRYAEREAYRVRDRLVSLFRKALKDAVVRRYSSSNHSNPSSSINSSSHSGTTATSTGIGNGTLSTGSNTKSYLGTKSGKEKDYVMVDLEGLRRLGFLKLFGLPSDLDHYASKEFNAMNQMHYSLQHHQMGEIFGNTLCYEERPGYLITVKAPLDIVYDPATERLTLMCGWSEQNIICEMARKIRC